MVTSSEFNELFSEVKDLRETLEEVQNQILMHRQVLEECLELRDGMAYVMGASKLLTEVGDRFAELELSLAGVSENTAIQGQAITALSEKHRLSTETIDAVVRAIKRLDRRSVAARNGPLLSARGSASIYNANGPPLAAIYGGEAEACRREFDASDYVSMNFAGEPTVAPRDIRGCVTTASSCNSEDSYWRTMRPSSRRGVSHEGRGTPHATRTGCPVAAREHDAGFAPPDGDWATSPGGRDVYPCQPHGDRGAPDRAMARGRVAPGAAGPPAEHGRGAKAMLEGIDAALAKLDAVRDGRGRGTPQSREFEASAGGAVAAPRRRGTAADQPLPSPLDATTEPEGEVYG